MPLNAAERGMYIYQTFSPVAAIATSCLFGSCARGTLKKGKLRHTRHRTQVRIRRNQTSETKFGTNCPKSEPNAVAYVSFLYTKQTTFRGWASLSIARSRSVPSGTHGSRPHEARRRCAREGTRHPGPVRHPAPEARRRRDTSEAPGGIHTLGRSAARRRAAPKAHHPALAKRTLGSPAREHSESRHSGGSLMHARSHAAIRMLVRCVVVVPHAILRYMPKFSQLLDNCEEDAGRRAHRRRTRKQTLRAVIDACPITCNPHARAVRGCTAYRIARSGRTACAVESLRDTSRSARQSGGGSRSARGPS